MKITKSTKIILSIVAVIWLGTGISVLQTAKAQALEPAPHNKENVYKSLSLFQHVLARVRENYVEDVSVQDLMEGAIEGMLGKLDPHTTYFDADDFSDFTTNTKGEFGGLGITISKKGDYVTVVAPIEGTPAYKLGIMSGDKISKVDGEEMKGISTNDIIKKMRGEKGTKVLISIIRPGVQEELDFDITRDIIKVNSVPYSFINEDGVGYIRLRQFTQNTSKEMRTALDDLEKQGIKGLLIDLRFNPGGLLTQAIETVNEFIGKDKLVVFTKGKTPEASQEYFTRYNRMRSGYPIVVAINGGSASAAEIFSGSMQDYDKALVVGEQSFGKGSVQRLFPLADGKGLKITTSKYYINSGRCIHKDINDRILKGENVSEAEKAAADAEAHEKIFKTQSGRTVYGGGGIMPDMTIEQPLLSKLGIELRRKNTFFTYSVNYMVDHEAEVDKAFAVSDDMYNEFMEFAKEKEVEYTDAQADSSKAWIKNTIHANIFRSKFNEEESYKISIKQDPQLQAAFDLFNKFEKQEEMFEYAVTETEKRLAKEKAEEEENKE